MNCYDCFLAGRTEPAVAVCRNCGAGLCADCARTEVRDHSQPATLGNPAHHPARSIVCASCDASLFSSVA